MDTTSGAADADVLVFEMAGLAVRLPRSCALRSDTVFVAFEDWGSPLGWHAHLVGDDGVVLLSFPWTDHVDHVLRSDEEAELPVLLSDDGWDDLDQGWWARLITDGSDLLVAETDQDAMCRVADPNRQTCPRPGIVLVDGVEVRWSSVRRADYENAWQGAIDACRSERLTPTGHLVDGRRRFACDDD